MGVWMACYFNPAHTQYFRVCRVVNTSQACSAFFKPGTANVKDVYGSVSPVAGWPLCSWCCGRAEASCPPSSDDDALHGHSTRASTLSVQFSHPERLSKPLRTFCIQLRLVSNWGENIQLCVGSWKPFAWYLCTDELCSTPTPEHFKSLCFLLLPLQAHTLGPEIHTRPLSYTVHKNTSHISQ